MSASQRKPVFAAFRDYQAKRAELRPAPPRPQHSALTEAGGLAREAKDFHWVDVNIPCQTACPSKTDIPGYLEAVAQGDFAGAYRINLRDNVFPAVLGRVCTRPCEPVCRHGWEGLGEPVAICFSKRSAADFQERNEPVRMEKIFPPTHKSIAIIGAGASGLAAARELALWGHRVVVFEKEKTAGGMMVQGIPEFRLPRPLLDLEIEQIRLLDVEIRCGVEVGRELSLDALRAEFDAVVLAAGTYQARMPTIPGGDAEGVEHGLPFLRDTNFGRRKTIGERVVVIGGGFTGSDCARMARRLGAKEVGMYYRRSKTEMYLPPAEIREMEREGITLQTHANPIALLSENGRVTGVRFIRTEIGALGPDRRRAFTEVAGSEFEVPADAVLLATGQSADLSWMPEAWQQRMVKGAGVVAVEPGLYLVGDFAAGPRTLIHAIADGRSAAREIDTQLMGGARSYDAVHIEDAEETGRTREMDEWPLNAMPELPIGERGFASEVETGYDVDTAKREAKRCYLCHYKFEIDNDLCIYCDRCLKVKPMEGCIVKVSSLIYDEAGRITGYNRSTGAHDYNLLYIDQSQCIRCGACKEVCPVECIDVQKVSRRTVFAAQKKEE
ncbi:MAG: FAD-dependent oxidoreductase [Kiritimatiellae bacterium]|nr:FAD-dependent oxidoreductase [Kiritimatiellia bacterium]